MSREIELLISGMEDFRTKMTEMVLKEGFENLDDDTVIATMSVMRVLDSYEKVITKQDADLEAINRKLDKLISMNEVKAV